MFTEPENARSPFNTKFLGVFRNILLQFIFWNLQNREMKNALFNYIAL